MEPLITMTGHVGQTPELRTTKNGISYTRFRIAHTPRILREGEWTDGETSWATVLCWRQLAENTCRSLRKGDPVLVVGRTRVESWADDETRMVRESLTIDARAVGHDLTLGASTFMRVRPPKPEGVDDDKPESREAMEPRPGDLTPLEPSEAEADGEAESVGAGSTADRELVSAPF